MQICVQLELYSDLITKVSEMMERSQEDAVKASNAKGRSQVYASENVLRINLLHLSTGALLLIESRTLRTSISLFNL